MKKEIFSDQVPTCTKCGGVVKPCIVFFGEPLPERFQKLYKEDLAQCDFLIVMGTSLKVAPFAGLVNCVSQTTPRLLVRELGSHDMIVQSAEQRVYGLVTLG